MHYIQWIFSFRSVTAFHVFSRQQSHKCRGQVMRTRMGGRKKHKKKWIPLNFTMSWKLTLTCTYSNVYGGGFELTLTCTYSNVYGGGLELTLTCTYSNVYGGGLVLTLTRTYSNVYGRVVVKLERRTTQIIMYTYSNGSRDDVNSAKIRHILN